MLSIYSIKTICQTIFRCRIICPVVNLVTRTKDHCQFPSLHSLPITDKGPLPISITANFLTYHRRGPYRVVSMEGFPNHCCSFSSSVKGWKNQGVFVKHYGMPLAATQSKKLFLASRSKSRSQGHWPWPWCHLKGHHWWSMHAKNEVSISYSSKVIAKVKVDNRQTNRQTDRTKTIWPRSFDPGA